MTVFNLLWLTQPYLVLSTKVITIKKTGTSILSIPKPSSTRHLGYGAVSDSVSDSTTCLLTSGVTCVLLDESHDENEKARPRRRSSSHVCVRERVCV